MMKFIEFLKSRPSDKNIRIWRTIFWLIILLLLSIYLNSYKLSLPDSIKPYEMIIKYCLFILWVVPIIMWIFDPCFAKRKYVKIIQLIFWVALIVVWNMIYFDIKPKAEIKQNTTNWSIDINSLNTTEKTESKINIGFWLSLLSILPILAGITWKCITQKCFKHWEIITKIRV